MKRWWIVFVSLLVFAGLGIFIIAHPAMLKAGSLSRVELHNQKVTLAKELQITPTKQTTTLPGEPSQPLPSYTSPSPEIVKNEAGNVPYASGLFQVYDISPSIYTDHWNWIVLSGDVKSNPSTGIVVTYYLDRQRLKDENGAISGGKGFTRKRYTIPGAGKISITGFSGTIVDFKSQSGHGTLVLSPNGQNGGDRLITSGDVKWISN